MSGPPAKKGKFNAHKPTFYKGGAKNFLEAGFRGFLATTNFREKECVRECYNILNSYADELYGAEQLDDVPVVSADAVVTAADGDAVAKGNDDAESEQEDVEEEDIATTLANEIESANAAQARSNKRKRFQHVGTGAANCVFIKTALRDPVRLVEHIVRDVAASRKNITRNVLRFVPVEAVCKANVLDIKNAAGRLFDRHFLNRPATTFAVVYNRRCNNDLDRDEVIRELAQLVTAKGADHKVDLRNSRMAVLVEIVKGLCCLSVVPDYMQLKKYNLAELAAGSGRPKEAEKEPATVVDVAPEDDKTAEVSSTSTNVEEIGNE